MVLRLLYFGAVRELSRTMVDQRKEPAEIRDLLSPGAPSSARVVGTLTHNPETVGFLKDYTKYGMSTGSASEPAWTRENKIE